MESFLLDTLRCVYCNLEAEWSCSECENDVFCTKCWSMAHKEKLTHAVATVALTEEEKKIRLKKLTSPPKPGWTSGIKVDKKIEKRNSHIGIARMEIQQEDSSLSLPEVETVEKKKKGFFNLKRKTHDPGELEQLLEQQIPEEHFKSIYFPTGQDGEGGVERNSTFMFVTEQVDNMEKKDFHPVKPERHSGGSRMWQVVQKNNFVAVLQSRLAFPTALPYRMILKTNPPYIIAVGSNKEKMLDYFQWIEGKFVYHQDYEHLTSQEMLHYLLYKFRAIYKGAMSMYLEKEGHQKEEKKALQKEIKGKRSLNGAREMESISLKSGELSKRGGGKKSRGWKKRFCILTENFFLHYYKSPTDSIARGTVYIPGHRVESTHDPSRKEHCFNLVPEREGERVWFFSAPNEKEKNEWMAILSRAVSGEKLTKEMLRIERTLRDMNFCIDPLDLKWAPGSSSGIWLESVAVNIRAENIDNDETSSSKLQNFYQKVEMLSKLRHMGLVSMYGYCKKDGYFCVITEEVSGTNFSAISNETLSQEEKLQLALHISSAMEYLHSKGVVHGNLNPENIWVVNPFDRRVKISNFGFSTEDYDDNKHKTFPDSIYKSPEDILQKEQNYKVDVFSFAIILYELISGEKAWDHLNPKEAYEQLRLGKRPNLPSDLYLREVIEKCWHPNPRDRLTFKDISDTLNEILNPNENKTGVLSIEDQVNIAFGDSKVILWQELTNILTSKGVHIVFVEQIRWLLDNGSGAVEKLGWNKFLNWFSPLVVTDNYHTIDLNAKPFKRGWTFEQICDLVVPGWFFGFLDAERTRKVLSRQQPGTFLIRFSGSNPGYFTLSVTTTKRDDGIKEENSEPQPEEEISQLQLNDGQEDFILKLKETLTHDERMKLLLMQDETSKEEKNIKDSAELAAHLMKNAKKPSEQEETLAKETYKVSHFRVQCKLVGSVTQLVFEEQVFRSFHELIQKYEIEFLPGYYECRLSTPANRNHLAKI